MIKLALITLLLFQSQEVPQTSFGFGAALAHAHPAAGRFYVTGVFCGRQLVPDPANTTGHNFYGNTICVDSGGGPRWFWFDWPADPAAVVKINMWTSARVVITIQVADPDCLLALSAVEGTVLPPSLVSHVSGSGVYGNPATLKATLTSGEAPLGGKTISFTLNGNAVGTAVTDAEGVATYTNVSLSGINAGAYADAVGAAFAGDTNNAASSGTGALTVSRADQTITFASLPDKTFGDPDFVVNAAISSGLSVNFAATGNCAVSGATVHLTGAGSCTVTASQAGDVNYNAAASVSRSFQVSKATTSVALASSATPLAYGRSLTFTATATSAAGTPTGSVQFKADGANLGSPQALNAGGVASISTAELPAGAHVVKAEYGGDANFNPSAGTLAGGQVIGGVFEFGQSSYSVAEGGSLAVTVRRTGDTSLAAQVAYSTDDASSPALTTPCSATTGLALARCDYTQALGTLRFAPGETEKTFNFLASDDSYAEGAETTTLRLSNPSGGSALGPRSSATLSITDDTPESTANPIDADQAFVRQHYLDFLNREPDAAGLQFWTQGIEVCGSDAGCREVKRVDTSAAFFLSIEFQETGYLVYRSYKVAFGDTTSPGVQGTVPVVRLDEFLTDTQRIGRDVVVNAGEWQRQLEENKQAFAQEFVQRQRFTALFPPEMPAGEFVSKLDENAGGVLSEEERALLVSSLSAAPSDASKRAQVFRQVAENARLRQREFNRAFVLMQYFGYLRRNPDEAPDSDFRGWRFWLSKLEEFGGDYRAAEMVKAFISSIEYRQRFGQ